jgi:hypothetical protein
LKKFPGNMRLDPEIWESTLWSSQSFTYGQWLDHPQWCDFLCTQIGGFTSF